MNNIFQLIQLAKSGGNAESILRQLAGNNPIVAQALKMVEGKTPEEINRIAANMAKERGTSVDEIKQQILQGMR